MLDNKSVNFHLYMLMKMVDFSYFDHAMLI